jgi:hypothetical protein
MDELQDDPIVRRIEALMPRGDETIDHPATVTPDRGAPATEARAAVPAGYELVGQIGAGGMGVVYKVKNLELGGRLEALKTIKAGEFAGPKAIARFRFGAEAAAGLDHPNIVTVYSVGEGPGGPYLTMRWVDGADLDERRPDSARSTAALMAKVAGAVHFAHQRGILHRDLKPANILVDAAGEPHVADFGIARRLDADPTLTQAGAVIGTAAYMGPEQARGEANLTVAADVYSLGVILYRLLTGRLPYTGTTTDILRKVQSAEAPPTPGDVNPAVDPDLEAVCLKCLEKDPADRYRTAGELAADLERFTRGEGVTARPPGFWDWVRQVWKISPEPSLNYRWDALAWMGAVCLAMHAGTFALAATGGSAAGVWAVNVSGWAVVLVIIWHYLARRFRHLMASERYAMMTAVGHSIGHAGLFLALVPLSAAVPAADTLALYPPLAALSGLTLFVNGATYWSRFLPIGLVLMLAMPVVLARWPSASPLVHAVVYTVVLWYWAYLKKVRFAVPR